MSRMSGHFLGELAALSLRLYIMQCCQVSNSMVTCKRNIELNTLIYPNQDLCSNNVLNMTNHDSLLFCVSDICPSLNPTLWMK